MWTHLHRVPWARTIARLRTIGRKDLSKAETVTVAAFAIGVPSFVEACKIIDGFHVIIRRKAEAALEWWIARTRTSRCQDPTPVDIPWLGVAEGPSRRTNRKCDNLVRSYVAPRSPHAE